MERDGLHLRPGSPGCGLEGDDVVDVEADADFFANGVIVVRRYQREHFDTAVQAQGVENLGPAKSLVPDFRLQLALVVVDDVVRTQQHFDAAALTTGIASLAAFEWQTGLEHAQLDFYPAVVNHLTGQENTLANEVGDKTVRWLMVQAVRCVPLLDGAFGHDADLVGHGEGFMLIMGHQHGRDVLALEDLAHFQRQALAQIDVEIREGFVEQDQLRTRSQRARQCDTLLLAAREFMRIMVALSTQADGGQQFTHPDPALTAVKASQAESDVGRNRQVREQRVVLKNHADMPLLRWQAATGTADAAALHTNLAGGDVLKTGDTAQQRRLAAARGSQQAGNAAGFDAKVHAIDDSMRSITLNDACQFEVCHQGLVIKGCRSKASVCACCRQEQAGTSWLSIIILTVMTFPGTPDHESHDRFPPLQGAFRLARRICAVLRTTSREYFMITHAERMQKKKEVVDRKIAAAQVERGVLVVNTGNGKGKSTAAFGVVARALGHGMRVAVVQFVKGRSDGGEEAFFRTQPGVAWHVGGAGFTWETQDKERDAAAAWLAWKVACEHLRDPGVGLVVLDEMTYAFKYGWLDVAAVLAVLRCRPAEQHVIVTGRAAPQALRDAADTVSDIAMEKHAFQAGVKAMPGLEW